MALTWRGSGATSIVHDLFQSSDYGPPPMNLSPIRAFAADPRHRPEAIAERILPAELRRGRGAATNVSGRFEIERREAFDDGWTQDEAPEPLATEVTWEKPKAIITRNDSPDIPFDRSINPYRGCEHGCFYCYARPTHAYMGLSRRARLRDPPVRQGGRGRAARAGAGVAQLQAGADRLRRQHRPLPADRAPVPHHPVADRGPEARPPPADHRHQVEPDPARPRPARADGARRPGQGRSSR